VKKKRTKKYNPHKKSMLDRKFVGEDLLLVRAQGQKDLLCFSHSGKHIPVDPIHLKNVFMSEGMPWFILSCTLCRDQFGEQRLVTGATKSKATHLFSDLVDIFHDHHKVDFDGLNKQHLLATGWIASPSGVEISDELAYEIFEKIGTWKYLAKWEFEKLKG